MPKKITNTISRQVSGRAQLPGVIIYIVDQESNTYKSGGVTWCILSLSSVHPFAIFSKLVFSTIWFHSNISFCFAITVFTKGVPLQVKQKKKKLSFQADFKTKMG